MAINYLISFTFTPATTISSSQVNTNFSDNANTWGGIEAKTKTFSNLGVDTELKSAGTVKTADGSVSAPSFTFTSNAALGLYVSGSSLGFLGLNAWAYRKPVLQYASATVVNMETGINGTSGQAQILFPDGALRTDSTSGRINCNFSQVAALTVTAQSGLRTGTVANNTWYAIYAVKSQVNLTDIVAVADVVLPIQANYATLNSNFGTNSWVYLGMARNGDNSGVAGNILKFQQSGNVTFFYNNATGNNPNNGVGVRLATSAGATGITYSYSAGTGAAQIPNHLLIVHYLFGTASGSGATIFEDGTSTQPIALQSGSVAAIGGAIYPASVGAILSNSSSVAMDIFLRGFVDNALGVGVNPLL